MTWTKLHDACEHHESESILLLARQESGDVCNVDDHGSTPLHILCWGNPDILTVKAILNSLPQAVASQDMNGDTPLHIACRCHDTDKHLVQVLIDADPLIASITNNEGLMPLHMACRHIPQNEGVIGILIETYPYAVRSMIKMGEPSQRSRNNSLNKTKQTDHIIIDPTAGMTHKTGTDLHFEASSAQIRDGSFPLHMALASRAPETVLELLMKEAPDLLLSTNKYGETPLYLALLHNVADPIIEFMLKQESKAIYMREKRFGNLPVHAAAISGCTVRIAKDLLELWPEMVHASNWQGLTAIDLAIQNRKCSDDVFHLFQICDHV